MAGVKVWRVAAPGFARGAGFNKALSYACYLAGTAWRVLRCGREDTVVSLTTPPLAAVLGRCVLMVRGSPHELLTWTFTGTSGGAWAAWQGQVAERRLLAGRLAETACGRDTLHSPLAKWFGRLAAREDWKERCCEH